MQGCVRRIHGCTRAETQQGTVLNPPVRAVSLSDLTSVLWRDWASAPLTISYMFHTFSSSYSVLSEFISPSFKIQFIPMSLFKSFRSTGICIHLPASRGPSGLPHSFGDLLLSALCYCLKLLSISYIVI